MIDCPAELDPTPLMLKILHCAGVDRVVHTNHGYTSFEQDGADWVLCVATPSYDLTPPPEKLLHEVAHALVFIAERGIRPAPEYNFGQGPFVSLYERRPELVMKGHHEAIVQATESHLYDLIGRAMHPDVLRLANWYVTRDTILWGYAAFVAGMREVSAV